MITARLDATPVSSRLPYEFPRELPQALPREQSAPRRRA